MSQSAFLPYPCTPKPESKDPCVCPWRSVGACANGCALDGIELQIEPRDAGSDRTQAIGDLAKARLCRSDATLRWRPALADDAPAPLCTEAGVRCVDGRVTTCTHAGTTARVLGVCIFGCEPAFSIPDLEPNAAPGSPMISDGVAGILCQPQHAERR